VVSAPSGGSLAAPFTIFAPVKAATVKAAAARAQKTAISAFPVFFSAVFLTKQQNLSENSKHRKTAPKSIIPAIFPRLNTP